MFFWSGKVFGDIVPEISFVKPQSCQTVLAENLGSYTTESLDASYKWKLPMAAHQKSCVWVLSLGFLVAVRANAKLNLINPNPGD